MTFIRNQNIKSFYYFIFFVFFITTPIISFIFKINLSNIFGPKILNDYLLLYDIEAKNGGVVSDLRVHWEYIKLLRDNFFNLIKLTLGVDVTLINYPLHHIIFSQIPFAKKLENYLVIFFILSFILPILVYKILDNRFRNLKKINLIILSLVILIFPSFQYSAIWGNNHITALIFFSLGIFYLNNFRIEKSNFTLIKCLIFFSLACYTKQFYVFIFIYLLVYMYKVLPLNTFIKISIFLLILGFPGLLFTVKNPLLLFGLAQQTTNFTSSILISGSIMFFYLIPFIIQYFLNHDEKPVIKLKDYFLNKNFVITIIFVFCLAINFEYNSSVGGGIFLKISNFFFNNNIILFIAAVFGIYFLFYFSEKGLENKVLTILLLVTFGSGIFIFQKYFEPMFFIIFLSLFDKKKIELLLGKNNFISSFYFLSYFCAINYIYFFGL
ncbi:MAG: hypothetical protein CBC25_00840 [Pelagibacteraceae bacterium TMED65]|nr:MAG: hypothetical protein CBC25_00840 [Pelagibacteraceae bacterium TMED65]